MDNVNFDIHNFKTEDKRFNEFISILKDIGLGEDKKAEGILYFAFKNNKISLNDIENQYPQYLESVNILNKLDNLNYTLLSEEAEKLRTMFFAITKDIRIIMLKIAFVVADLRSVDDKPDDYKKSLANSIFALFAPLSARLGLSTYKTELEDGAFKLLYKDKYDKIQAEVDNRFHKRQPIVDRLKLLTQDCLNELGIKGKIYGRKKHIYSIYKKLQSHPLDNIYDLIAVRAIVKTVPDCYALLGRLHSKVEPLQKRFKDYIAIPKSNGYQSLHTTVIFEGFPVEVQIRTEDMHKYAEYGVAAHWIYKEKRKHNSFDDKLAWIREMMEDENISVEDLSNSLNQDIYDGEIFVQTPKGKVIYLPKNATPIDFAYAIHSEVGNKCVGAKVNNKIVSQTSILHNGDVVEIITNPNSKGPSRDWLKICQTSEARSKINAFFKKNMKEENIKLGKTMLENAIKDKGFSTSKLLINKNLKSILDYYNFSEDDELYANIGSGAISPKLITNKLATIYQKEIKTNLEPQTRPQINLTPSEKQINIKGLNNILINFAKCCQPMPGDDIIGFVSSGRGIIIHRSICPNISYFSKSRLIEANWKPIDDKFNKTKKINNKKPQNEH